MKKEIPVKNPNEIVFTKTKGVGAYNFGKITSSAIFNDTGLALSSGSKWIGFIKGKQKSANIEYQAIDMVEIKTHFSKGDLISGIIIGIISIVTVQLWGLLFVALLLFCSYGKNIIVTGKNLSKFILMSEGFGETEEFECLSKKLGEKGITIQANKK
jgi:hypothetical protein